MRSLDTNLLLYAFAEDCPEHAAASAFLVEEGRRADVVVSEWVLVELYNLLRNPAVIASPLSAEQAAEVVQVYRRHPYWGLVSFPLEPTAVHDALWLRAGTPGFPRRGVFDARMALCLRACGVTEFATANVSDFDAFGFSRVWNPLAEAAAQ